MNEPDPNNERRIAAHIGIAINQLMRYGSKYKGMGWVQGFKGIFVTLAEASVLVDYYLENGIVDSFTHEQAPLLWRNKTAGVRGYCTLIDAGPRYIWEFETLNRKVRWSIPNIQTNELFAEIEKGEPKVDPMNIPIEPPQKVFHLNQVLSPESLLKMEAFRIWLQARRASQQ